MKPAWLDYLDAFHNALRSWSQLGLMIGVWIWQRRQARATEKETRQKEQEKTRPRSSNIDG